MLLYNTDRYPKQKNNNKIIVKNLTHWKFQTWQLALEQRKTIAFHNMEWKTVPDIYITAHKKV